MMILSTNNPVMVYTTETCNILERIIPRISVRSTSTIAMSNILTECIRCAKIDNC